VARPTGSAARRRTWVAVAVIAALVAGLPASAVSAQPSASGDDAAVDQQVWRQLAARGTTTFWVYLDETADLTAARTITDREAQGEFVYERLTRTAARTQAGLRDLLDAQGADYRTYWIANAVRISGDERLLRQIAARPEVARITANETYEISEPIPARAQPRIQSVEWGLDRIGAPAAWSELDSQGDGIVVATIDTGVMYTHAALVEQYRGNLGNGRFDHDYQWHDPLRQCGSPSLAPCDVGGHGTHVTGTMVGDDRRGNQIGVAPRARWIAAKACQGVGCDQGALLSAGQFVLAPTDLNNQNPRTDLRPHVVNNSWHRGGLTDPWYVQTVRAWVAAGIFPQFASGNTPGGAVCGSAGNPGNLPESYSTGAFDIDGSIAGFSNRGASAWDANLVKPNLAAPGVAIRSASLDGGYEVMDGTSMASPHVAGAVALLWSAAGTRLVRDVAATRALLDRTAIDTSDLTCGGTPTNNNVWGEGKLDAYTAIAQSPRDPTGTLAGRFLDAVTGAPIGAATVTVEGGLSRERTTGANGGYRVLLPGGDYTVTASAFGYVERTVDVTVTNGQATMVDIRLTPLPRFTVSGTVTDGSGQGWPLAAEVFVRGTPATTFSDPATGQYRLRLPANATHLLEVEPQEPGYHTLFETVALGSRDVVRNLRPAVDTVRCIARGYEFDPDAALFEDFDALTLPPGWSVVDHIGEGNAWRFDNPGGRENATGGDGGFAIVDSDFYGLTSQDTELVSPVLDLTEVPNPVVHFNQHFTWSGGAEFANVDVSLDGGATWQTVLAQAGGDAAGPRHDLIAVPQAAGQPRVQIRFHFGDATFGFWWMVDNAAVGACRPT
jgi:subtilisin family serine protease